MDITPLELADGANDDDCFLNLFLPLEELSLVSCLMKIELLLNLPFSTENSKRLVLKGVPSCAFALEEPAATGLLSSALSS